MKKSRILISFMLIICIMCGASIVSYAANTGTSGDCTWVYSGGKLTISGSGKMGDYTSSTSVPWYSNAASITSLEISSTVTHIGTYAFAGLTSLSTVTIPENITSIGGFAFKNCSALTTVNYNAKKCTYMGGSTSVPVFYGCSKLTTINFGENVKYIPEYAFYYSSVPAVAIPESVYSIGAYSFAYCTSLKSVYISDKLTEIPEYAFYGCTNLSTINTPNLLSTIGRYAFYNCTSISELNLPATVSQIGYGAFEGCTGLKITTVSGSYAELVAKQYEIPYTATSSSVPSAELKVNTNTNSAFLNGSLVLGVKFDQELDGECVHAAFYDASGKVVNYFIVPVFSKMDNINILIDADDVVKATYAKIFVWDSLESCMPISPAETVSIR